MKDFFSKNRSAAILTYGGLLCLLASGCSFEPAGQTVTGTLTLAGKPLCSVGLRFYEPTRGEGLVANVNANGEYSTPSPLAPGTYMVSITGRQPGGPDDPGAPPPSPMAPDFVPRHYLNGATSTLTAVVTETDTRFDFTLTDKELKKGKKGRPTAPTIFAREG